MRYIPIVFFILIGCLEPFEAGLDFSPDDVLVVDGFADVSTSTAIVKLSRTQPISGKEPAPSVSGSTVSIVGAQGLEFRLKEELPGTYSGVGLPFIVGQTYELHIKTSSGREFYSDPVVARATPPIDSVTFAVANSNESIDVRVNSRDVSGEARYFSWDYVETYEYTSFFNSGFTFVNKVPKERAPADQTFRCWRTIPSSSIGIVTTRELSASVVNEHPIIHLRKRSIKISARYSVLVKQRVVGSEEYNYLNQLKKNTESLGGLFDPQPSLVVGNLHEKDKPTSIVLGYFSASEVSQRRVFLRHEDLPEDFQIPQDKGTCQVDYTCDSRMPVFGPSECVPLEIIGPSTDLLFALFDRTGTPYSYAYVPKECSDCRLKAGITTRPDFW